MEKFYQNKHQIKTFYYYGIREISGHSQSINIHRVIFSANWEQVIRVGLYKQSAVFIQCTKSTSTKVHDFVISLTILCFL